MSTRHQRVLADMAPHGYGELRRWVRSWMAAHPVAGVEPDDVALAMTELVSNSIEYGSGPVMVDLVTEDQLLRLDVGDCSEDMPRQPPARRGTVRGRGLLILDELTTNWGVRLRPQGGKTVWCECSGSWSTTTGQPAFGEVVVLEKAFPTCTW
jgi:anti-sigma regulatory factor (Ser/Thr protein kinase)